MSIRSTHESSRERLPGLSSPPARGRSGAGGAPAAQRLQRLQRTLGNRGVAQLLRSGATPAAGVAQGQFWERKDGKEVWHEEEPDLSVYEDTGDKKSYYGGYNPLNALYGKYPVYKRKAVAPQTTAAEEEMQDEGPLEQAAAPVRRPLPVGADEEDVSGGESEDELDPQADAEEQAQAGPGRGGIRWSSLLLHGLLLSASMLPQAEGGHVARRPLRPFIDPGEHIGEMADQQLAPLVGPYLPMVNQLPGAALPMLNLDPRLMEVIGQLQEGGTLGESIQGALGPEDLKQIEALGQPDAFDHPGSLGLFHEHLFFENGTNIGFFDNGLHEDDPELLKQYVEPHITNLDDASLSEAVNRVRERSPFKEADYELTGDNCQVFVKAVLDEYNELTGESAGKPTWTDSLIDMFVALDDASFGSLESQVQEAVDAELNAAKGKAMEQLGSNPFAPLAVMQGKSVDIRDVSAVVIGKINEQFGDADDPEALTEEAVYEVVLKFGRETIEAKLDEAVPEMLQYPGVMRRLFETISRKIARYVLKQGKDALGIKDEQEAPADPFAGQYPRGGTRADGK